MRALGVWTARPRCRFLASLASPVTAQCPSHSLSAHLRCLPCRGLYCHPTARVALTLLYYGVGVLCVRAALTARSALGRGLPMLALLLVRLSAFVARGLLEPPSQALLHYAAMEVGTGEGSDGGGGGGRQRAPCARQATAWCRLGQLATPASCAAGPAAQACSLAGNAHHWLCMPRCLCCAGLLPGWRAGQRAAHPGALAAASRPRQGCAPGPPAEQPPGQEGVRRP